MRQVAPPDFVADPHGDRERVVVADDARKDSALRRLMADPDGRLLVRWLLDDVCQVGKPAWDQNALVMAKAAGAHYVGDRLQKQLQRVCPLSIIEMRAEQFREAEIEDGADHS